MTSVVRAAALLVEQWNRLDGAEIGCSRRSIRVPICPT